jgi:SAM-dependent methyltransferase
MNQNDAGFIGPIPQLYDANLGPTLMIPYAREILPAVSRVAELPFDSETFDVVVCQLGVMFFPDRPAAFRETYCVLKNGGRFVFNVPDSVENNLSSPRPLPGSHRAIHTTSHGSELVLENPRFRKAASRLFRPRGVLLITSIWKTGQSRRSRASARQAVSPTAKRKPDE